MPKITVLPHAELCPEGKIIEAAPSGETICDVLLDNGIEIDHACEKSCACTTCHVIVRQGFDSLPEPSEIEEDLLDQAWGLEAESRLSCQAKVCDEDLVVEIPKYTINHAREEHWLQKGSLKWAALMFSGCLRCSNEHLRQPEKLCIAVYQLVRVFGFACAVVMRGHCACLHGFHGYGDFLRFGVFEFEI